MPGARDPVVVVLLLIAFFSAISGKPLDGLLILLVAAGLAWDAWSRRRHARPAPAEDEPGWPHPGLAGAVAVQPDDPAGIPLGGLPAEAAAAGMPAARASGAGGQVPAAALPRWRGMAAASSPPAGWRAGPCTRSWSAPLPGSPGPRRPPWPASAPWSS